MTASLAPVHTVAEIRELERAAMAALPGTSLMARAGRAAADWARELAGEQGTSVLVLAGPGNNGGDAFELAGHLKRWFYRVSVVFTGDAEALPTDAAEALAKWRAAGGELLAEIPQKRTWHLVVDGLYGIGLSRPIAGRDAALIEAVNRLGTRVLALDIPSGLTGDTGEVAGPAIRATHTITFIALKPGLVTNDGPDTCGEIRVAPLDLDVAALVPTRGWFVGEPADDDRPPPRPRNFHKGLAGTLAIVGGSAGMVGAALLAGRAALRVGAGKVWLGLLAEHAPTVDFLQPELMLRKADGFFGSAHVDAVAIGPGLGTDTQAQRLVNQALRVDAPVIVDADALNLIAQYQVLQSAVAMRTAPTILTPHPAEAARLLGVATTAVQGDRLRAAREIARRCNALVVLKGTGSIIAAPDGRFWINGSGNPGMASAGMGDVLTGLLGGLAAQGLDPEAALRFGVWVHGRAADDAVASGIGPAGLTASDVIDAARRLVNVLPS